MIQQIFFIGLTVLVAGAIGLLLRYLLVRRLKKTVLDAWLIQTIGIIAIVLPLCLAAPIVLGILSVDNLQGVFKSLWGTHSPSDLLGPGESLLESLLILTLSIGIGRTIMTMVVRHLSENRININTRTLIGRVLNFLVLGIACFWILAIWQISIGVPVAILGTLTVAFTFAIQDILKDLVAGFYILVERPFHIGDEISLETFTGRVVEIRVRATLLRLVSGEEITIPNARIFSLNVVNNTFYGERRVTVALCLPQESYERQSTEKQILSTLQSVETIMPKPEPTALLSGYEGEKLTLTVRFWIASGQFTPVSDVIYNLRTAFPHADISIKEAAGAV